MILEDLWGHLGAQVLCVWNKDLSKTQSGSGGLIKSEREDRVYFTRQRGVRCGMVMNMAAAEGLNKLVAA